MPAFAVMKEKRSHDGSVIARKRRGVIQSMMMQADSRDASDTAAAAAATDNDVQVVSLSQHCPVKLEFHYADFASKLAEFVMDFPLVLSQTKFCYSDTNGFITDFLRTL